MDFLTSNRLLPLSELLEVYVHLGIAEFDLFVAFRHHCEEVSLVGELGLPKKRNKTRTRGIKLSPSVWKSLQQLQLDSTRNKKFMHHHRRSVNNRLLICSSSSSSSSSAGGCLFGYSHFTGRKT